MVRTIETDRLILRAYEPNDHEEFISLFTDPRVMNRVDKGAMTQSDANDWWERLLRNDLKPAVEHRAVIQKTGNLYIGNAVCVPRDATKQDIEIGYILKEAEWGKGFATEIARAQIEYCRLDKGLEIVWATVDDDHEKSIRVLEKAGMSFSHYEFDEKGRFSVFSTRKTSNLV